MTREDLRNALALPNVAAFLRVLRAGESSQGPDAYRMLFGKTLFDSYADHPRRVIHAKGYTSSAAGAYQFIVRTWDGLAKQYGFTDFSPSSQDEAAVALIAEVHALEAVIAGDLRAAIRGTNRKWASLPGSPYGQPTRTYEKAAATFLEYGGTLAEETDSPVPVAPDPITPEKVNPMGPWILPILEGLVSLLPQLGGMFANTEVSRRNVAAGTVVADAIVKATGQVNLQAAAEAIQNDPTALQAARQAVADVWPSITESSGGGINKARTDAASPEQIPFYKNPAVIVTFLLTPLIYMVVGAVVLGWGGNDFSDDIKTMVVTGIVAGLLSSVTGFFMGSSMGSQKKDAAMGAR